MWGKVQKKVQPKKAHANSSHLKHMFIGVCKEGLVDEASLSLVEKEEMFFLHCGKCIAGKKFKVERRCMLSLHTM